MVLVHRPGHDPLVDVHTAENASALVVHAHHVAVCEAQLARIDGIHPNGLVQVSIGPLDLARADLAHPGDIVVLLSLIHI